MGEIILYKGKKERGQKPTPLFLVRHKKVTVKKINSRMGEITLYKGKKGRG